MATIQDWDKVRKELAELETIKATQEENAMFKKDVGDKLQQFLKEQEDYRKQSEQKVKNVRFK